MNNTLETEQGEISVKCPNIIDESKFWKQIPEDISKDSSSEKF